VVAKVGYAIKDGVTDTGKAVGGAAQSVGRRARTVAEKTADTTAGAVNKTRDFANDTGDATARGAKTVGVGAHRATRRVSHVLVGRSDAELSRDVRDVLSGDPQTASVKSEVKSGAVTLTLPPESRTDLSAAITRIRRIDGVQSVMVVHQ
jgi:hypothetical protein